MRLNFETEDTLENLSLDTILNFSENVNVHEMFVYIEDNIKLSNRLKANVGLHAGYYSIDKYQYNLVYQLDI